MASLDSAQGPAIVVPGYEDAGPLPLNKATDADGVPSKEEWLAEAAKKAAKASVPINGAAAPTTNPLAAALASGNPITMPANGIPANRSLFAQQLATPPPAPAAVPQMATSSVPPATGVPQGTHYARGPGEPLLLRDDQDAATAGQGGSQGFGLANIAKAVGLGGPAPSLPSSVPTQNAPAPTAASNQAGMAPIAGRTEAYNGVPVPPEVASGGQYQLAKQQIQSAQQGFQAEAAKGNQANIEVLKRYAAQRDDAAKELFGLLKPGDMPLSAATQAQFGISDDDAKHLMTSGGVLKLRPEVAATPEVLSKDASSKLGSPAVLQGTPGDYKALPGTLPEKTPDLIKEFEYSQAHPDFAKTAQELKGVEHNHVVGSNLVDPTGKVLFTAPENATLSPDAMDSLAERSMLGDHSGLVGMGRGKQGTFNLTAVQNRVAQLAEERGVDPQGILDNIAELGGQKAGARTAGQIAAKLDTFGDSAVHSGDYAIEMSSRVPRSTWVPLNQLQQMGQRIESNTDLGRFNAANETLVNEYSRAINIGSGQTTDTSKAHAYAMLNLADSPETYKAIVNSLQWEVNNVHNAATGVAGKLRKGSGGPPQTPPLPIPGVGQSAAPANAGPVPGTVLRGFKFRGGDPGQQGNWERAQ